MKTAYTCHSYNHSPLILLLQDAPKYSLLSRESFELTALQFLAPEIPLQIISRTYRVSTHSQLFLCPAKDFEILFGLSTILNNLLFLEFLHTCIPVNSIGLAIYFKTFVIVILILLIQHVCECTQSSFIPWNLSFRLRRHFKHELDLDQSNVAIDCTPKAIQLIHP
jgi:hypothetical protein